MGHSAPGRQTAWRFRVPRWCIVCEAAVFLVFAIFFLLYGVTPWLGGDGLGLVGADEPRYAQIAREMLVRFDSVRPLKDRLSACIGPDRIRCAVHATEAALKGRLSACVTPYLYGRPWLEKPALYYWRAMFLFQDFGVHDWSARLPSTTFAFIMVALIYLHMRRFRPGGHLDAALITAACAGIIGFARGASTDMQMAAPLAIGLLGWYAWYETDSKFWLYDIYFFTGLATLAKGPVAPLLAMLIITAFAFLRKEWSILRRSLWWPGIVLYFAMVLPWFIAVQHQNPTFFREFFLEHNLERFATDRYQHNAAVLVLPGGDAAGAHALDRARCARLDRRHPDLRRGVEAALLSPRQAPALAAGRRIPRVSRPLGPHPRTSFFPSPNPNSPVTFFPPSRPSRFSLATTSSAAASLVSIAGFFSGTPRFAAP